ncbi:hypothetical protein APR04_000683 [Promicromonospora umidemergens]|uniref:DUF4192 family protein n=1 Tax=Promicromonospora umidemergens TaxID=629679 RepID=A0ABP8XEF9_9MICO|nr:hypothetical protein [Promicromonospora umidemergens]MCP2281794.1 hypothetical protein [Promicromonospora umidemergens]
MDDLQEELGQYLAHLRSWVGRELTDPDLAVAAFDRDGRTTAHTTVQWNPDLPHHNVANDLAYQVANSLERQDEISRMLVIEYGPPGQGRAAWLANALHGHFPVTPGQIHAQDDTWRTQALTADGWGADHPLPQGVLATDLSELTVTARALDQTLNPTDPLPTPLFDGLEPNRSTSTAHCSPRARTRIALRALKRLSAGRPEDPAQMQVLAHLISSDITVQDAVLMHTVTSRQHHARTQVLVRTFRAAPAPQRPALAITAATAAFLTHWPRRPVLRLLLHAEPFKPLTALVSTAIERQIHPDYLRQIIVRTARRNPKQVDATQTAQRSGRLTKHQRPRRATSIPPRSARADDTTPPGTGPGLPSP